MIENDLTQYFVCKNCGSIHLNNDRVCFSGTKKLSLLRTLKDCTGSFLFRDYYCPFCINSFAHPILFRNNFDWFVENILPAIVENKPLLNAFEKELSNHYPNLKNIDDYVVFLKQEREKEIKVATSGIFKKIFRGKL